MDAEIIEPGWTVRPGHYVFVLYVAGTAPRSLRAIANTRRFCEVHLAGRYELDVVDIYQHPAQAEAEGILAVPALLKTDPPPARMFVGDMTVTRRVLESLGVLAAGGGVIS